jgi:hypothetical protein
MVLIKIGWMVLKSALNFLVYKSDSFGRVFSRKHGKKNVGGYFVAVNKGCEGHIAERENRSDHY